VTLDGEVGEGEKVELLVKVINLHRFSLSKRENGEKIDQY
jgi:hypothetical protein